MSNYPGVYEKYKNLPLSELAEIRVNYKADTSSIAQLVYEEKMMEQKHELDLKLLQEQTNMMKSSNRLIAIATISAALLGAIVGAVLQYKLTQKPISTTQQSIQSQIETSTSASRPEKTTGKVPSPPPLK